MNSITSIEECGKAIDEIKEFLFGLSDKPVTDYLEEITDLRGLLNGNSWPTAIPPTQLCLSEEHKMERARWMAESLGAEIDGRHVLDFGCGEGHFVTFAKTKADFAMGYDIISTNKEGCTTNWDDITQHKFNCVVLHDVLDHVVEEPVEILNKIKSVLSPGGTILVRCHPWCSRHGGHLYRDINKAFVHIVFTDDEIIRLGGNPTFVRKVIKPKETYEGWFGDAGLEIIKENVTSNPVEDFFNSSLVANRLRSVWGINDKAISKEFMKLSFLDYVLVTTL